jgi:ABC-2 type transport system permease protein
MTIANVPFTLSSAIVQPTFVKLIQGEIFKLLRNRGLVVTSIILLVLNVILQAIIPIVFLVAAYNSGGSGNSLGNTGALYITVVGALGAYGIVPFVSSLVGIFVTVATVISVALEYQQGTIRVLLARGIGRLELLGAKITSISILALVGSILLGIVGTFEMVVIYALGGKLNFLTEDVPSYFGHDLGVSLVVLVINLAATMLLALMFSALGRSLAFGLGLSLPYFFVENILVSILTVVSLATNNGIWYGITRYFFGVNLTEMPRLLLNPSVSAGSTDGNPVSNLLMQIDGTHTLVVVGVYMVIFAVVASIVTRYRDVLN